VNQHKIKNFTAENAEKWIHHPENQQAFFPLCRLRSGGKFLIPLRPSRPLR
jgi:hypothetical protein